MGYSKYQTGAGGRRKKGSYGPDAARQRADLGADQEVRKGMKENSRRPFGLVRLLASSDLKLMVDAASIVRSMDVFGDKRADVRTNPNMKLLSEKELAHRIAPNKSMAARFAEATPGLIQTIREEVDFNPTSLELDRAFVLGRTVVAMRLRSEALDKQRQTILDIFDAAGLTVVGQRDTPLHVSVIDTFQPLSNREIREAKRITNEFMPVGQDIALSELSFYGPNMPAELTVQD